MNLALGSLILVFLLIPGIAFRISLIKSDSFENPLDTSLRAEIGLILISTTVIHLIGTGLIEILGYSVDVKSLYGIIIGNADLIDLDVYNGLYKHLFYYIIIQSIVWSLLGVICKIVSVKRYWDLKYNFLPMTNEWDALLSGRLFLSERSETLKSEVKDLKKELKGLYPKKMWLRRIKIELGIHVEDMPHQDVIQQIQKDIRSIESKINAKIQSNFVKVDLVVEAKDCNLLYRGKVHKYFLSKNNSLDKIVLKEVAQKKMDAKSFKIFSSQYFVIQYSDIKNMNITFQFLAEDGSVIVE